MPKTNASASLVAMLGLKMLQESKDFQTYARGLITGLKLATANAECAEQLEDELEGYFKTAEGAKKKDFDKITKAFITGLELPTTDEELSEVMAYAALKSVETLLDRGVSEAQIRASVTPKKKASNPDA